MPPRAKEAPKWAGPFWSLLVALIQAILFVYRRLDALFLKLRGLPPRAGAPACRRSLASSA
jgi:hypothetical protein